MTTRKTKDAVKPSLTVVEEVESGSSSGEEYRDDNALLDEYEQLARDCILSEDDGDEPGEADEIKTTPVEKQMPRFSNFRANPATVIDMWGTSDRQGMDELVYVTTRQFAPNFEDDVDLRRIRFFETVTPDAVVRLVYCFMPEGGSRKPNLWITSKLAALTLSLTRWTTMRSRRKLQQYTFRPSRKDYGEPHFSGLDRGHLIAQLKQHGLLVVDKSHPFYKKATDTDE